MGTASFGNLPPGLQGRSRVLMAIVRKQVYRLMKQVYRMIEFHSVELASMGGIRWRATNVVEIVAVKAPENDAESQLSTAWSQRVQSKTVIFHSGFNRLQQVAKSGSGPRSLPLSSLVKSTICKHRLVELCGFWRFSRLQNRLRSPSDHP